MKRFWRIFTQDESFFLHCCDLRQLVKSQWNISANLWLCYRLLSSSYLLAVLIYAFVSFCDEHKYRCGCSKFFIFLTFWNFMTLNANFHVKCFAALRNYSHLKDEKIPLRSTWALKTSWILTNVTTTISILVTIVYWSFIFDSTKKIDFININVHVLISVFVLVDLFLVAIPICKAHFYQPLIFGTFYFVFSYIYWLEGGTDPTGKNRYVYKFLNWDNYEKVLPLCIVGGPIGLFFLQCIVWIVFLLRTKLFQKWKIITKPQNEVQIDEKSEC